VAALFDLHNCRLQLGLEDRPVLAWPPAAPGKRLKIPLARGACRRAVERSGKAAVRSGADAISPGLET
jgi:hypothetical protein